MSGTDALYDARIKSLAAQADAIGPVEQADCRHEADNFLCGDRVSVELALDGDGVKDMGGKVRGCLLVQAAAALIKQAAPGLSRQEMEGGIRQAQALMTSGTAATGTWEGLNAFTPVHGLKHRHDCVLLPFEALKGCLDQAKSRSD
ncbi:MAG: iron-sulfur cluster assembly scaffold protein [Rhodospirillales bacterium]